MTKPEFYECGICGHLHRPTWNGDCREDDARFTSAQLDEAYGVDGWDEVPMPGTDEDEEAQNDDDGTR